VFKIDGIRMLHSGTAESIHAAAGRGLGEASGWMEVLL